MPEERSPVTLSIVIVNWNTRDHLLGALESIYSAPPAFPFEVIVVDNASHDGSAEAVAGQRPQVELIANRENAGYAQGNNQAMQLACGAYVLLLNPDVTLPAGALDRAVAFMEERTDAGALGVLQRFPNGEIQRSLRGFPTPQAVLWELIGLSRLFPGSRFFSAYRMNWFHYDRVAEVDQPMGTFLLIRRKALDAVGPLDEAFPIFFNEVDWLLRSRRAGWKTYFTPDVEIVHYGGASTEQVSREMAWESRRGLLRFYKKHYGGVAYLPLRLIIAAGSWLDAAIKARTRKRAD
jgi:GT2 family glycosyltransferase